MDDLAQLEAQVTVVEEPKKSANKKPVTDVYVDEMLSLAIAQFRDGKETERSSKPITDAGNQARDRLKQYARDYVQREFHGTLPPERVRLVGQDGQSVTLSLSAKAYGDWNIEKRRNIRKAGEIRDILVASMGAEEGNAWFDAHFNDQSRIVIRLPMVKNASVRSEYIAAISALVKEFESKDENGKSKIPPGTLQVQRIYDAKESLHKDLFGLPLQTYSAITEVLGGCDMTARM